MEDKFAIHLFTPEDTREDETSWLIAFLRAGLDILHIRKPGSPKERYEEIISAIPIEFHNRLVLHDYPSLAKKYGCGFQLNNRVASLTFRPSILSRSCHSIEEAMSAKEEGVDYVTLSPIFNSISKEGYVANGAFERLEAEDLEKVIALGGVTLDSLPKLKERGYSGAALLGEVWNREDGCARLLKYLRMRNVHFQFITNGKDPEETIHQAAMVLEGGCRWIQVRMKDSPEEEIIEVLDILRPLCEARGATLIVDDHYQLVNHCHGVHLGQNDASVEEVRKIVSPEKIIGLTVNHRDHIEDSRQSLPDYYGVGPFRFTSTKKRLAPVLGLSGYKELSPLIPRPFVAIGGIGVEDIPSLNMSGVKGVAVSGAIIKASDPKTIVTSIIEKIYGK